MPLNCSLYPRGSFTKAVPDKEVVKLSITLTGQCDIVQANLILEQREGRHRAYYPLLCGGDSENICRATLTAGELHLLPSLYQITAFLATKAGEDVYDAKEWSMGVLDFTNAGAELLREKRGTADQQEDFFEKVHPENRPTFGAEKPSQEPHKALALLFAVIVLLPWVILVKGWSSLHSFAHILVTARQTTLTQKLAYLFHLAWIVLAFANWTGLSTSATLKVAALISAPSFYLTLTSLRQSLNPFMTVTKRPKRD